MTEGQRIQEREDKRRPNIPKEAQTWIVDNYPLVHNGPMFQQQRTDLVKRLATRFDIDLDTASLWITYTTT